MMVPPHCQAAWRIVARYGRYLLALAALMVLSIGCAALTISLGVLLLGLAVSVYSEAVRAIRSLE